tara:strand:- start:496 stop:1116 length:621 start_codon:yes stop_codon:yes gene_type:complete
MNTLNLFSKVIFTNSLNLSDKNKKQLNKVVKEQKYNKVEKENSSSISESLHLLDDNKLTEIKKTILDAFIKFNKDILKYDNDFKMTTCWATKSNKNNYSNFHNHTNNFYSGVYYIEVDKNTGEIEFCDFNNNTFELKPKEYNIHNSKSWKFKPYNDMIIFFPSELHHMIHLNTSNKDRYSLAFNFFPVGEIGTGDSTLHINKNHIN